jgi:hypothetical protein
MNMTEPMTGMNSYLTGMDLIVGLAILFTVAFLVAWMVSPRLRAWVERPKYRFQKDVRNYDQAQNERGEIKGRHARS